MVSATYDKILHAVRYWLLRRLPACKQMLPVMSQSLERSLNVRERVTLKLHLWVCAWCAWYLEHLHVMRDALRLRAERELLDDECPPATALSDEARARLKRALSEQRAE